MQAAATAALIAAPLYWYQGRQLRTKLPRLAEAPGQRAGIIAGSAPTIRIAAIGESPLAARGLADQAEGVIARLATALAAACDQQVEWQCAARSGATARFAHQALLPELEPGRCDWVIISLGVNDSLKLRSARAWRDDLKALISAVHSRLEPGQIVLTGIPPMERFPALPWPLSGMLGLRARLLDTVSLHLAEARPGLVHTPLDFAVQPEGLFCRDGFHPNARAHALWARQLAQLIAQ